MSHGVCLFSSEKSQRVVQTCTAEEIDSCGDEKRSQKQESSFLLPFSSRTPNMTRWRIGSSLFEWLHSGTRFQSQPDPFRRCREEVKSLSGTAWTEQVKRKIKGLSVRPSSRLAAHSMDTAFNGLNNNAFTPLRVFM